MGKVNQLYQDLEEKTNDELKKQLKALLEACEPFKEAYKRVVYCREEGFLPSDDAQIMLDQNDSLYELFADGMGENELLRLGHLANLAQHLDS